MEEVFDDQGEISVGDSFVFCETNTRICPLVGLAQYIIDDTRLITLIAEVHEGRSKDGDTYTLPEGSISLTTYVEEVLKNNSRSLAFLEIGDDICPTKMRKVQSRPIRELGCRLEELKLTDRLVRFDVRNLLMNERGRKLLYCGSLTWKKTGADGTVKELPIPLKSFRDLRLIWKGDLADVASDFLKTGRGMILNGDVSVEGNALLLKMNEDVNRDFRKISKTLRVYAEEPNVNFGWWKTEVVRPLRVAWSKVLDYFIVRDIFTKSGSNEYVIIVGFEHARHINRLLGKEEGVYRIKSAPNILTGENGCVPLAKSGPHGRVYGIVATTEGVCEAVNALASKPEKEIDGYSPQEYEQVKEISKIFGVHKWHSDILNQRIAKI
jgi:hypothetical protein